VNSAAAASCELFPGDELLSIDGVSTRDMPAAQASILKSSLLTLYSTCTSALILPEYASTWRRPRRFWLGSQAQW
jgi:hypothetical protein